MNLSLRDCTLDDSALLLSWRNSDFGRIFSRNSDEIDPTTHERWIKNKLSSLQTEPFWIILSQGSPAGYIRFDISGQDSSTFSLSILVTPEFQGTGVASEALQMAIKRIRSEYVTFSIDAEIHKDNLISMKFFHNSQFVFLSENGDFNNFRFLPKEV
jgi:RimJ/RimL family protein N-acetyltransferase